MLPLKALPTAKYDVITADNLISNTDNDLLPELVLNRGVIELITMLLMVLILEQVLVLKQSPQEPKKTLLTLLLSLLFP